MIPSVLIADPDQALLETIQQTLGRYRAIFTLHTASNGTDAVLALNDESFSLLIADANTSIPKGPLLVDYVWRRHPLLPVIVTGHPASLAACAQDLGTRYLACLRKPFDVHRLVERILVTIDWEADGGTLHEVSTFFVPQMLEMERKTCTVKVTKVASARNGILFFSGGILIDALCEGETGESAAWKIFSWDKVRIIIHNSCSSLERKIYSPVSAILLEAMRLRDEAPEQERMASPKWPELETPDSVCGAESFVPTVAKVNGVEDIYRDDSWDHLLDLGNQIGMTFGIGPVKVACIAAGHQASHLALVPGAATTVVAIEKHSFKEEILEALLSMKRRS